MSWRPARAGDLPVALLWAVSAVLGLLSAPALPLAARLAPPCALHELTGLPCVACGSTRAALALAHGEWLRAIALNPLAALGLMGVLGLGLAAPAWALLGGPLPRFEDAHHRALRMAAWGALAAQWAYLLLARR